MSKYGQRVLPQIARGIRVLTPSIGRGACARFGALGVGAAAGRRSQMCGCVRFRAWALAPLQGAARRVAVWLRMLWSLGAGDAVWPCSLWSLDGGAAAGCCCRVRLFFALYKHSLGPYDVFKSVVIRK